MNHEKLECYRLLASIAEEIARRVTRWPKGNAYLADQITRAIASSVLNLAEGNGKKRYGKDRHRFFAISLGSIAEVSACLDLARAFGLIPAMCAGIAQIKAQARIHKDRGSSMSPDLSHLDSRFSVLVIASRLFGLLRGWVIYPTIVPQQQQGRSSVATLINVEMFYF